MKATYYLFQDSVQSFDHAWKNGEAPASFQPIKFKDNISFEGVAFLQSEKQSQPSWIPFIVQGCDIPNVDSLHNQSNSFVLLLMTGGRLFAITFGQGYHTIDPDKIETDFGLKVALNSIDPTEILSLQTRNLDPATNQANDSATVIQKLLVANRGTSIAGFDLNLYSEIVAKLEGVPFDKSFGRRVSGSDACRLTAQIRFDQLDQRCRDLLAAYNKKDYKKNFPLVDKVKPIKKKSLTLQLDTILRDRLRSRSLDRMALTLPDISSYDEIESYEVACRGFRQVFSEFDLIQIIDAYHASNPTTDDQLALQVRMLDASQNVKKSENLRKCLLAEATLDKQTYVLSLGKWFRVSRDYIALVNKEVAELDTISSTTFLPHCNAKETEGAYNSRAAKLTDYGPLDKNLASIPGEKTIEICDLFSPNREFVHVKKYKGSSSLSHLFAQGSVSAQLFHRNEHYRHLFQQKLPQKMRGLVKPHSNQPSRFSVVYAIIAPANRKIPSGLPIFSKINLLFHVQQIRAMGYPVKFFHIPVKSQGGKGKSTKHAVTA